MDNFYIAIYDYYNNFLMEFYNIKDLSEFLKVPIKKIVYSIRNNRCLIYNNRKIRLKLLKENKKIYDSKKVR